MSDLMNVEKLLAGDAGGWKERQIVKRMPQDMKDRLELTARAVNLEVAEFEAREGRKPTDKETEKMALRVALKVNGISKAQLKQFLTAPLDIVKNAMGAGKPKK